MYIPSPWTRDTVTNRILPGFFCEKPVTKPVTSRAVTRDKAHWASCIAFGSMSIPVQAWLMRFSNTNCQAQHTHSMAKDCRGGRTASAGPRAVL